MHRETIWVVALVLAGMAGWIDWRTRRIPNWLTVSGFAAGIAANAITAQWGGVADSLKGAGLALLLLLPAVLLRGLGAGDWKLMGALGASLGTKSLLVVLTVTIFLAGCWGGVQMIRQRRVRTTLANLWELVRGFVIYGLRPHPEINLDQTGALRLPFGTVTAIATLLCFWMSTRIQ